MSEKTFSITREKHLDHMVRIVPFITFGHGAHCFILMQFMGDMGPDAIIFLSLCLLAMIAGFLIYDSRQRTILFEDHMETEFFGFKQTIKFQEILEVDVLGPEESFSTVKIRSKGRNFCLYFVDDGPKIKEWIISKKHSSPLAA